jgi:HEPN domain-containing protein
MGELNKDLLDNFEDFLESADRDFNEKKYNPSISSYFKAIVILCDYFIYRERGLLPKNHKERFLFLEIHYPEAYHLISPLFKEYTDSYNVRISKEQVVRLRDCVEKLKRIFKVEN